VLSASMVIAAPAGGIGAPRWLIAREYVSSVGLECSTPRFDKSDGPFGERLKGAGSPAAVIGSLIARQAAVVPQRHQQYWCAGNLGPSFAAQFRRIQRFTRLGASTAERPDERSAANRGAVAPEPKEWC
jgi:hypothetical protein